MTEKFMMKEEFMTNLPGKPDIADALARLDRITQKESLMTAVSRLGTLDAFGRGVSRN